MRVFLKLVTWDVLPCFYSLSRLGLGTDFQDVGTNFLSPDLNVLGYHDLEADVEDDWRWRLDTD